MDKFLELPKEDPSHLNKRKGTVRQQKAIEPEEMKQLYQTMDRDEMQMIAQQAMTNKNDTDLVKVDSNLQEQESSDQMKTQMLDQNQKIEESIQIDIDEEWFPVKFHVNPAMRENNNLFFQQIEQAREFLTQKYYQKYNSTTETQKIQDKKSVTSNQSNYIQTESSDADASQLEQTVSIMLFNKLNNETKQKNMCTELNFLKIIQDQIRQDIEDRFKEYFINENFETYEQIQVLYTIEFKPNLDKYISKRIFKILELSFNNNQITLKDQDSFSKKEGLINFIESFKENQKQFRIPKFLYLWQNKFSDDYIQEKLMPEFQQDFKLPTEKDWQNFLDLIKEMMKDIKDRKIKKLPFYEMMETEQFKKSLQIVLYILKNLQINDFVKLNREVAPDAIDKFEQKYSIEEYEPNINYQFRKAGTQLDSQQIKQAEDQKKHLQELIDIIKDTVTITSPFSAFQNKKKQDSNEKLDLLIRQQNSLKKSIVEPQFMTKQQFLFSLLYVVFRQFIKNNYNGVIRQLMKLFLREMLQVIGSVISKVKEIKDVSYLLTIFENYIVPAKIQRDKFDLRQFTKHLLDDELINRLNIKKSLEGCNILEMERISDLKVKSKHVVICITGFLQEDQNKGEFWIQLKKYYKNAEIFAVSWNACTTTTFLSQGVFNKNDKKEQNKKSKPNKFYNLINIFHTGKQQFVFAVDQAVLTGIILGFYLAKSSFAENRAISLVGYSLGGVVSFNCMKYLNYLSKKYNEAGKIINDVQIWAGAYVIDISKPKKPEEIIEKSRYCNVVNGNLNNLYCDQDTALKIFFPRVFQGLKPIGLYRIFEDIDEKERDSCKLAVNYDVKQYAKDHSEYGPCCGLFLPTINDAY